MHLNYYRASIRRRRTGLGIRLAVVKVTIELERIAALRNVVRPVSFLSKTVQYGAVLKDLHNNRACAIEQRRALTALLPKSKFFLLTPHPQPRV